MDLEQFKNISYERRDRCLICEKKSADPVIELPDFPLTEIYVDRKVDGHLGYAPQAFSFCEHCGHGQLANVIDLKLQYSGNYFFRTSQSASARETSHFFTRFMVNVVGEKRFDTIVEIGCNDLYLLKTIKSRAKRLVGIDPILKGKEQELSEDNVSAIGDFFENVDLQGNPDVVICKDALEHVGNPKQLVRKVVDSTSKGTLYFFQFPLLNTLIDDGRFDQMFHQHLNYFSIKSILHMLDKLGCGLLSYTINYDHWAAILIAFQKGADNSRYSGVQWDISRQMIVDRYRSFLVDMDQTNRRLQSLHDGVQYGYGAALMLPVLSYHMRNDFSGLKCIIDDDKNKDGMYYLNLPVPIVHSSKIQDIEQSSVLLTSTSSKINTKSILAKLFQLNPRYILYPLRTI